MTNSKAKRLLPNNRMVSIRVADLTPLMIDWLIAREEVEAIEFDGTDIRYAPGQFSTEEIYSPSTCTSIGHPILEREKVQLRHVDAEGHPLDGQWMAQDNRFRVTSMSVDWRKFGQAWPDLALGYLTGPTMLIAGLRFIIARNCVGKCIDPKIEVPAKLVAKKKR